MPRGGCYCGSIRYEVSGAPVHRTNCHCSICRRTSAAPHVPWFSVLVSEFKLLRGVPTEFQSSPRARRSFCPHCGTPLTFYSVDDPQYIDITSCSLDNPEACPPENHTYTADALAWEALSEQLPRYPRSRSEG